VGFEVIEERDDHRGVEVIDAEHAGGLASAFGDEAQQEPERVAVGGDGVGTGPALLGEQYESPGLLTWASS
jgi:hypothetical protein